LSEQAVDKLLELAARGGRECVALEKTGGFQSEKRSGMTFSTDS